MRDWNVYVLPCRARATGFLAYLWGIETKFAVDEDDPAVRF